MWLILSGLEFCLAIVLGLFEASYDLCHVNGKRLAVGGEQLRSGTRTGIFEFADGISASYITSADLRFIYSHHRSYHHIHPCPSEIGVRADPAPSLTGNTPPDLSHTPPADGGECVPICRLETSDMDSDVLGSMVPTSLGDTDETECMARGWSDWCRSIGDAGTSTASAGNRKCIFSTGSSAGSRRGVYCNSAGSSDVLRL